MWRGLLTMSKCGVPSRWHVSSLPIWGAFCITQIVVCPDSTPMSMLSGSRVFGWAVGRPSELLPQSDGLGFLGLSFFGGKRFYHLGLVYVIELEILGKIPPTIVFIFNLSNNNIFLKNFLYKNIKELNVY